MSLILDALKKLDREKSSRGDRTTNIATDILGPDLPHPGKRIMLYVATVFLTAVAATVITYGVIAKLGFQSKSSAPSAVSPPAAGEQIVSALPPREPVRDDRRKIGPVSPGIQSPAENQQVAPAPPPREPIRDDRDKPDRVPSKIEKSSESKKPAEIDSPAEIKKSVTTLGEKTASQNDLSGKGDITSPPTLSAATLSSLRISGIVWHKEPSERFAVINGMITKEGSVIEGVKILEIFPDRVQFSQKGLPFEIPLK